VVSYTSSISKEDIIGRQARQHCWKYDWVLDLDIRGFCGRVTGRNPRHSTRSRLRKLLQPKGGAGGFACVSGFLRLLPQAPSARNDGRSNPRVVIKAAASAYLRARATSAIRTKPGFVGRRRVMGRAPVSRAEERPLSPTRREERRSKDRGGDRAVPPSTWKQASTSSSS
jgi:hypothetical protein